jgi:lipoprotein-anchoring transpeptidase ErfK/SrfK
MSSRRVAVWLVAAISAAVVLTGCAADRAGTGALATAAANSPVASTPAPSTKAPQHQTPVEATRCTGKAVQQLVTVSIRQQHLWLCHLGTLVLDTAVTTGASGLSGYDATPTGTFHIQERDRNTVLTLNTGRQYDVKYWIPFSAPLYGFHDSPWQTFPYGSPRYATEGSHGCVHMPLAAIQFLYNWVRVGATVHIFA